MQIESLELRRLFSAQIFPGQQFAAGQMPRTVLAGDFNQDGQQDLMTTSDDLGGAVCVLLGRGDATFAPPVFTAAGARPFAAATGDFNSDGKLDLIIANGQTAGVSVLLGKGDGSFQPRVTFS